MRNEDNLNLLIFLKFVLKTGNSKMEGRQYSEDVKSVPTTTGQKHA